MPKQKTDDLLHLVQSLTRAEKRHFRLFVRRNQASEDILFLQLFDFLDKHQTYDEQLILEKLPGVKKRQLSNLKAHLYKQLLVSLRLLNTNHIRDIQIRELVDFARVLYNKGLYRQSLNLLDKAKQQAAEQVLHPLRLEVLDLEKHIEGQYITRSIEGRAEELARETDMLVDLIRHANAFSNLSLQLYGLYLKAGYVRNEEDHNRVRVFFQDNLPEVPFEDLDFIGKLHYCQAHVWYHYMLHDFAYCYRYAQKWVDLFRESPHRIEGYASLYLKGMHNLLTALFNVLHYDKFVEVLEELHQFPQQVPFGRVWNIEGLYFLYRYTHTIQRHFLEGTFSEGTRLIPELDELIHSGKYNWDDHRIFVFYYSMACMYFGAGDHAMAIHYLNLIINRKNPDYRADIQSFARILNLIAHFELGNAQLVEYQVKSVYRFLAKVEDLQEVQREIFRFLRRTPKIAPEGLRQAFTQLKDKLVALREDPYERRPFLYLDIISWLESKIADRPVQEIVQAKFRERQARLDRVW